LSHQHSEQLLLTSWLRKTNSMASRLDTSTLMVRAALGLPHNPGIGGGPNKRRLSRVTAEGQANLPRVVRGSAFSCKGRNNVDRHMLLIKARESAVLGSSIASARVIELVGAVWVWQPSARPIHSLSAP
jgi:hypothetical protein